MPLKSYLAAFVAAITLFSLAAFFLNSRLEQVPNIPATPLSDIETLFANTRSAATREPAKETPQKKAAEPGYRDLEVAASRLRASLVNIICVTPENSTIGSISGTGVIIDQKGFILTNAHIGQYFLLDIHHASCRVRTGSPATDAYRAKLVFISEAWLRKNADALTTAKPVGTGERDFAVLAITEKVGQGGAPTLFPFVPLAVAESEAETQVIIGSYGAEFLGAAELERSLFPTITLGSVKDLFTFAKTSADVLSLGGSAAAQEGSSGGGVVDETGLLIGLITTSTTNTSLDKRNINALAAPYVRRAYREETGRTIDDLISEDPRAATAHFEKYAEPLKNLITAH